jgi:uncharacterized membrane protein YqjE
MLRIGQLSDAARFVIDQFETYLDLAQTELSEQRREMIRRVVWALVAWAAAILGFGFLFLAILIVSWDSAYRMVVAVSIPIFLLVVAAIGFAFAARASSTDSWARIRAEIQRDLATLREILWTR